MRIRFLLLSLCGFGCVSVCAAAEDIHLNVYYVCDVGRVMVEGCEIRDTSDKGECFVEYTDKVNANGSPSMKSVPRGELRIYLARCKQPAADSVSRADAFRKRQQDQQDAIQQKNLAMMQQPAGGADPRFKGPEERQKARCLTSGRLTASCLGNQLSGGLAEFMKPGVEMANQMLGTTGKNAISLEPVTGPYMSGVYTGPGSWYLDFTEENVQMKCADLSAWPDKYSIDFRTSGAVVTVQVNPRPVVLAVHGDGKTLTGSPGAVVLDGFVPDGGSTGGGAPGHYETSTATSHQELTANEATQYAGQSNLTNSGEGTYDLATTHTSTNYVGGGAMPRRPTYKAKRVTCPALNLSNNGASMGEKTIETNFMKSLMGSGTGAPTPPGIRMNGIYANNSTGFSAQFFPESVILGCGPDVAKAYPYTVAALGGRAVIHVAAPDHPLTLTLTGTTLDAGTGSYQVHGRTLLGRKGDDFAYAPAERSCALGPLEATKTIPTAGGNAAGLPGTVAAAGTPGAAVLATPEAPTGNAVLKIINGFPPSAAAQFAGHGFALLRTSFIQAEMNAGATTDPNASPYMVMGQACGTHSPMCQQISESVKAQSASVARADASGSATLPGVPPGRYFLLISIRMSSQLMAWLNPVDLKPGTNTFTLTPSNATPVR